MPAAGHKPLYHFWTPRYWPAWLGIGLLRLSCLLPHRAHIALGKSIGRLAHRIAGKRRAITRRNIELCFPELSVKERDELALRHFEALGASLMEMALGRWASDEKLARLTTIEGLDDVKSAMEDGVPVIVLGAHLTCNEISGRVVCAKVPPLDGVQRPFNSEFFTEFMRTGREQSLRRLIDKNDIRAMVRSLRQGTAVWYAPDQSYDRKSAALLPFFGVPAMCNTATTTLAKLGKAMVVPYMPRRNPDGSYTMIVYPALEGVPSDDPEEDTRKYNALLEEHVRQCPEQYFWIHRIFKNRPAPLPDVYADLDALK